MMDYPEPRKPRLSWLDTLIKTSKGADMVITTDGNLSVSTTGWQGSRILSPMSQTDYLIRLPCGSGPIFAGAPVDVIPFLELF